MMDNGEEYVNSHYRIMQHDDKDECIHAKRK